MTSRVSQGSGFQFGRKIASHGVSIIGNHLVSLLARKIAGEGRKRRKTNHVGTGTHKKRVGRPRVHHKAGAWQLPHARVGRGRKHTAKMRPRILII